MTLREAVDKLSTMTTEQILELLRSEGIKSTLPRWQLVLNRGLSCGCPLAMYFAKYLGETCRVGFLTVNIGQQLGRFLPESAKEAIKWLDANPESEFWSKDVRTDS